MTDILSLTPHGLEEYMAELGEKRFRAAQVFEWLHAKRVSDFSQMTSLSLKLRESLASKCELRLPVIETVQESALDGTKKYLMNLADGESIESVLMSYEHGYSVCISSQVGCAMGCAFCASTVGGKVRDLTASEMLGQIYAISKAEGKKISSVVVMGIGEPLDNYDNLMDFIEIITNEKGYGLSNRAITVSTCGLCDRIDELAERRLQITLAVSLHASTQEKREKLMPVAKKFDLDRLMRSCRGYFEKTGRRLTFEYALIKGKNDSNEDASELAALLSVMHAHVNLIPVNPARSDMIKPDKGAVYSFQNRLKELGINATVRRTLGTDIDGACGQLRRKSAQNKEKTKNLT